jgi:predicted Zn-ribbon and HTH transcriptional regulator
MGKTEQKKRFKYEVADILEEYLDDYRKEYRLSYEQIQAVTAIMRCRTPALGGYLKVCEKCGKWEFGFRACKNRHCPKCGNFEKAQWIEKQKVWLLPIPYFHLVFTIDHIFNPLVRRNRKKLYEALIEAAAETLKRFGQEWLGGEIGFTLVMHTWGQQLQQHLHGHFIVTGGALISTGEGYRWQEAQHGFLFPAKLFSKAYKQAFIEKVRRLWQAGELDTGKDNDLDVSMMIEEASDKKWSVYIQPPVSGTQKLLDYLGRYVYRIAISNHRITKVKKGQVTFEYYDNRDEGQLKTKTVSAVEFIRLFLMHVLPRRFVRIRHFGLHHSSCREKLKEARKLLGLPIELPVILKLKLVDWLMIILETDQDPRLCPHCGEGLMIQLREFGPIPAWKTKLLSFLGLFTRWKTILAV